MSDAAHNELIEQLFEREPAGPAAAEASMRRLLEAGAARLGVAARAASSNRESFPGPVDLSLARLIDHTILKPEATPDDIARSCEEAWKFRFAAVCVNPLYVRLAARWLEGSSVAVCSVAGFPLGGSHSAIKAAEAARAVDDGATEIDMVLAVGMLRSGEFDYVEADIRAVADALAGRSVVLKVILETALLTDDEKVAGCVLAQRAGADFVKTSTGFSAAGATVQDVRLMRRTVGEGTGVKAAGGIRTPESARAMLNAGASRIGASASVAIVGGASESSRSADY